MPVPPPVRCTHHPAAHAGWRCEGCKANLCPDCVSGSRPGIGVDLIASCCKCGAHTPKLTYHRSKLSYGERLLGIWRYPFSKVGLISMAALGIAFYVLGYL